MSGKGGLLGGGGGGGDVYGGVVDGILRVGVQRVRINEGRRTKLKSGGLNNASISPPCLVPVDKLPWRGGVIWSLSTTVPDSLIFISSVGLHLVPTIFTTFLVQLLQKKEERYRRRVLAAQDPARQCLRQEHWKPRGGLISNRIGSPFSVYRPIICFQEELVINGAAMNIQLYGIESQILKLLSESEGNILDNTELIGTLAEAKARFPVLLYLTLFVACGDYARKAACRVA